MAASLIGNLAVTLGLNTAAFEAGATKAEVRAKTLQGRLAGISSAMKGFAGGLIAGGVALGATALAKNAFDIASALDESAQKMGVTVEALQRLNLAATQNGISEEALASSMAKLNKSMGALAEGSKPAVAAFAKLGLSAEDLKNKSPDQALAIIADRLNALPTVQERVAVGSQIMGKGFSQLLPLINGGSDALAKYAEQSQRQGEITTEEAKRLDDLADSWDRVKIRVGVFAAKMIATFAELVDGLDKLLAKWYAWRDGTIAAVEGMASKAVAAMSRLVEGVKNAFTGGLGKWIDWAKEKIQGLGDKFKWLWDVTVGHSYVPDMVEGIGRSISELQKLMVDPALTATEKVAGAFQALAGTVGGLFGRKTGGILSSIANLVSAVAPLFGGAKIAGPTLGGTEPVAVGVGAIRKSAPHIPGLATGGSGVFGGFGGVDKNVLSLNGSPIARVSRGEHFSVSRSAQRPYFDLRGAVMTQDLVRQMNEIGQTATGRGAILGAAGAEQRGAARARRAIP